MAKQRYFYAVEYALHRDAVNPSFPLDILVHRYEHLVNRDDRVALERNRTPLRSRWRRLPATHAVAVKARAKAQATGAEWPVMVTMDSAEEMGVKP